MTIVRMHCCLRVLLVRHELHVALEWFGEEVLIVECNASSGRAQTYRKKRVGEPRPADNLRLLSQLQRSCAEMICV